MKHLFALTLVLALCVVAYGHAQPLAREIAFTRSCSEGVPLFDKASRTVKCGAPAKTGAGYVLEMAVAKTQEPTCPAGYGYIGSLSGKTLAARGIRESATMQYFACAKE